MFIHILWSGIYSLNQHFLILDILLPDYLQQHVTTFANIIPAKKESNSLIKYLDSSAESMNDVAEF